jgi:hypothetical protein
VARRPRPDLDRGLPLRSPIIVALCLAIGLAGATNAHAVATGPFEPNDSITAAYGPLAPATPYNATVEAVNDPDWYYLDTNAAGPVQLSMSIGSCTPTTPGTSTCSNVQLSAYDSNGGLLARGVANQAGQTLQLNFDAKAAGRISLQVTSGVAGATYSLTASFPSAATTAPPTVKYPDVIAPFSTRFEMSYTGTARKPRNRAISGLVVQGVAPGSTIVVRCTKGCTKRYEKSVVAKTSSRRLRGLPLRLKSTTQLRIEVRRTGYVGRFKIYGFTPKGVPSPKTRTSGCTSPYDFSPILCAS